MLQASRRTLFIRTFIRGQRISPAHTKRTFSQTSCSAIALSLPSTYVSNDQAAVRESYAAKARRQKYDDLLDSLSRDRINHNRTWAYYIDLLDFTRDEHLPLELHQRVLRKCTLDVSELRAAFTRSLHVQGVSDDTPHMHETRFLTVINNIRRAGWTPALEDYNFILTHFAAVGHYVGATQILQEINKIGLEARTKTYNLCLQAIAYRLTLPCGAQDKEKLDTQCARLCFYVLNAIRKRNESVPSVCIDLALRIMKDTGDTESFMSLLKVAYSVDMEYPDRHPLASDGVLNNPEPLSTAALTTVVDFFGRQKQVSKMVVAFEVLGTPLKACGPVPQSRNFDDDDDDDFTFPSDLASPSRPLPSAQANITTYNTLIRHCAQLAHTTLARHYALQATDLDRLSFAQLREGIQTKPLSQHPRPEIQVDIDTFRPILGLANRDKDAALLKWLMYHVRMVLRRKKDDFRFFSAELTRMDALRMDPVSFPPNMPQSDSVATIDGSVSTSRPAHEGPGNDRLSVPEVSTSTEPSSSFFTPSAFRSPFESPPSTSNSMERSSTANLASAPVASKTADLVLVVGLLQRDIATLSRLDRHIGSSLVRLYRRLKEKMGRRVWKNKNVYLRDVGKRMQISREAWAEIVNFEGDKTKGPFRRTKAQTVTTSST
ncbi:hypothetical protein M0805_002934 [Coniferiporia weirii]|nr:hypothetical protein M0805_002934 [Coniferiporia weirii]